MQSKTITADARADKDFQLTFIERKLSVPLYEKLLDDVGINLPPAKMQHARDVILSVDNSQARTVGGHHTPSACDIWGIFDDQSLGWDHFPFVFSSFSNFP